MPSVISAAISCRACALRCTCSRCCDARGRVLARVTAKDDAGCSASGCCSFRCSQRCMPHAAILPADPEVIADRAGGGRVRCRSSCRLIRRLNIGGDVIPAARCPTGGYLCPVVRVFCWPAFTWVRVGVRLLCPSWWDRQSRAMGEQSVGVGVGAQTLRPSGLADRLLPPAEGNVR